MQVYRCVRAHLFPAIPEDPQCREQRVIAEARPYERLSSSVAPRAKYRSAFLKQPAYFSFCVCSVSVLVIVNIDACGSAASTLRITAR